MIRLYMLSGLLNILAIVSTQADALNFACTLSTGGTSTVNYTGSVWVPPGLSQVKGILMFCPGSGSDERVKASQVDCQNWATAHQFAIIGNGLNGYLASYFQAYPQATVAQNVNAVLTSAAQASGHPEIVNAPLALTGFSAGGWDVMHLAWLVPERVIAAVSVRAAPAPSEVGGAISAAGLEVPTLILLGGTDPTVTIAWARPGFTAARSQGALLAMGDLGGTSGNGHFEQFYNINDYDFALYYLSRMASGRCPSGAYPSTVPGNPLALVPLNNADYYLAQTTQMNTGSTASWYSFVNIAPVSQYQDVASDASVLPNKALAMAFRAYSSWDGIGHGAWPQQSALHVYIGATYPTTATAPASDGFAEGSSQAFYVANANTTISASIIASPTQDAGGKYVFGGWMVDHVDFYLDDQLIGTTSAKQNTWNVSFNSGGVGAHALIAVAYFANGVAVQTGFNTYFVVGSGISGWRAANFNSTQNSGTGSDFNDPAGDNVPNLFKYALGFTPSTYVSPLSLPTVGVQTVLGKPRLVLTFARSMAVSDVTYVVEVADDLAGPWAAIDALAAQNQLSVVDNSPSIGKQLIVVKDTQVWSASHPRFMRLRVTTQ